MGEVFLARDDQQRTVAVKVIRPELAANRDFRIRFRREVDAARAVSGRYTATVVDADPDGPVPWLATAHILGPTLADAVEEHGPLPPKSVLALGAGLAEALIAVHSAGLVHRDLKPSNVLLSAEGPRVIDFGIVRATDGYELTLSGVLFRAPRATCAPSTPRVTRWARRGTCSVSARSSPSPPPGTRPSTARRRPRCCTKWCTVRRI
ncbi:serine/threonine-protein kinase [Streptomyces sp. GLT-R25]